MEKSDVRMIEFIRLSQELKAQEAAINRELSVRFPETGPVRLLETRAGEIAVKMSLVVRPGQKDRLDEVYRFIMERLGQRRGRKPGEKRIQVKYRLPEDLYRRVREAAQKARMSASDLVAAYLRERLR